MRHRTRPLVWAVLGVAAVAAGAVWFGRRRLEAAAAAAPAAVGAPRRLLDLHRPWPRLRLAQRKPA